MTEAESLELTALRAENAELRRQLHGTASVFLVRRGHAPQFLREGWECRPWSLDRSELTDCGEPEKGGE